MESSSADDGKQGDELWSSSSASELNSRLQPENNRGILDIIKTEASVGEIV